MRPTLARLLPAAPVSDLSGPIAGTVFQRCKSGLIAHTKSAARRRAPGIAQTIAHNFSRCIASWRALSLAQRAAWSLHAKSFFQTNPDEKLAFGSAINAFSKYNLLRLRFSQTIATAPPSRFARSYPFKPIVAFNAYNVIRIAFVSDNLAAGDLALLEISQSFSVARRFHKTYMRLTQLYSGPQSGYVYYFPPAPWPRGSQIEARMTRWTPNYWPSHPCRQLLTWP